MRARLDTAAAKLEAYSPYGVLGRGYSLTTAADGSVVRDASALRPGDVLTTRFARGEAASVVQRATVPSDPVAEPAGDSV